MPGRNPQEATKAFLLPIERSLRCLSLQYRFKASDDGQLRGISLNGGEPARFSVGSVTFDLTANMKLEVVVADDGDFRLTTRQYIYEVHQVTASTGVRAQIVRWHWHPGTRSRVEWPHVHFPEGLPFSKTIHVPTGRITFEDIVEFMIVELTVKPGHQDWRETLNEVRNTHVSHRSWNHRPTAPS